MRVAMLEAGISVFRINPKRSRDAAEVYDGVPCLHDAKSAAILTKPHLDGLSEPWPESDEHQHISEPWRLDCASWRSTRSSSVRTETGSRRSWRGTGPSSLARST